MLLSSDATSSVSLDWWKYSGTVPSKSFSTTTRRAVARAGRRSEVESTHGVILQEVSTGPDRRTTAHRSVRANPSSRDAPHSSMAPARRWPAVPATPTDKNCDHDSIAVRVEKTA